MYSDIKTKSEHVWHVCAVCLNKLEGDGSPWSICFDPEYKRNIWGGDSHEYRGLLCQQCASKILKNITQ